MNEVTERSVTQIVYFYETQHMNNKNIILCLKSLPYIFLQDICILQSI